jgi:hypothetical protein
LSRGPNHRAGRAATEHRLSLILVDVLRADPKTAIAMYHAVQSLEARRYMLIAAANARLPKNDQILFEAVIKAIRPSRRVRHAFAHHIWGVSPDLPDDLLLIDPEDLLRFDADAAELNEKMRHAPEKATLTRLDTSKIAVWRKDALERAVKDAGNALDTVSELEWSFHWDPKPPVTSINVATRQLLLSRPLVAAHDAALRKENARQAQPQQPKKEKPSK